MEESKSLQKESLVLFNSEDEKKDVNIIYTEVNKVKKIKYISLDLLLKKIVIDDFIEKNQLLIYYFCRQCFCFIDIQILFNKITNCYDYYRTKGVPAPYLSNLITFFNILVIEMYQYYNEIKNDHPILELINQFYDLIEKEFSDDSAKIFMNEVTKNLNANKKREDLENMTDRDENDKIEMKINLTRDISKNLKLNDIYFNGEINHNNENNGENNNFNNYLVINDDNEIIEKNIKDDYFENTNIDNENNIKRISHTKEEENKIINDVNDILKIDNEIMPISRKTVININHAQTAKIEDTKLIEKDNYGACNTLETPRTKEDKNEIYNSLKPKKNFFFNIFKKNSKISDTTKKNKSCDVRNSKNIKKRSSIKIKEKKYKTSDEKILSNVKDIKNFIISSKRPNKKLIDIVKNSIIFYKNINSRLPSNKDLENSKTKLKKSLSQDNIKNKKAIKPKKYFNVLDWEEKDIGNKLMTISESLLNKVQRKELYKAVFLKKNKNQICPNVMENIEKFNRLSFFIILDILSYDNPKDRAKMIEKWIKIEEYCKNNYNFNDMFAINSALNNYIITGLKITLKEVRQKFANIQKELNKLCDCKGNYKNLREHMANLQKDEYYLPYLGILLRDLAFYEEKSKYIIKGVLINFEKIEIIQKIMEKFFKFKYLQKKEIGKTPKQLIFLDCLENIQEEKLEKIANNIEPNFNYSQRIMKRFNYVDKKFFSNESNSKKLQINK